MRSGGVPTSVLWGDTASLSPPSDSRSLFPQSASDSIATMNCFEGLPPASHHHHAVHHAHHPHVIHLLPHSAPATPPTTPNNNNAASPPPADDREFVPKEEVTPSKDREMIDRKEIAEAIVSPEAASPLSTAGQGIRSKEEPEENNLQDDSGISPGSRGSGASAERSHDVESVHSSGREEEEEAASPHHDVHMANVDDQDCPSPGSSDRGPSREGRGEDGIRCTSSPFSEECYSGGEDSDALRRLQYSVERGAPYPSEESNCQGGESYDGSGPRPDGMASDEDDGSDMNVTKPRITSQGKLKTFRCKQCDFVALTKLEFWEHSRMHIRAERLLTCPRCPFVTEYKHHLEYHLRNHFGSKPFKCPHCSYTCVNKSMLNSHLKSHSSVYQYRCADCGYATKYCHSLKLHLRKYNHQPAMVLHPDGSPNPLPVIDVYGTRRGPKNGSKKCNQAAETGTGPVKTTSPTLVTPPSAPAITVTTASAVPILPATSAGHPYHTMLVYPSPPSPAQQTPTTAASTTYMVQNGGPYFTGPVSVQPSSSIVAYPTYTTPQTSRPIMPRILHPTREGETIIDGSQNQWAKEDADLPNGRKILTIPSANNRPIKCTLCEFVTTSREAFAEHMMVHAANGDVGNKDAASGATQNELSVKAPQPIQQAAQPAVAGGNGFSPENEAGLNECLARMLTAVVPQIGTYRGPVPPHLQAQWHAHIQQQMQQQQQHHQQLQRLQQQNNLASQQSAPLSPQRPWLRQAEDVLVTVEKRATESPKEEREPVATEVVHPEKPNGGIPLDLTKESTPRQDDKQFGDEKKGAGGSSRRKGRAFKLERISALQDEEGGRCSDEDDDRQSKHSDEEEMVVESKTKVPLEDSKVKNDKVKDTKENFHCPYCDIAFRDLVLYTMHMGYHGYQDPFKCNMCGEETNDKVSFFLHIARSSHS